MIGCSVPCEVSTQQACKLFFDKKQRDEPWASSSWASSEILPRDVSVGMIMPRVDVVLDFAHLLGLAPS